MRSQCCYVFIRDIRDVEASETTITSPLCGDNYNNPKFPSNCTRLNLCKRPQNLPGWHAPRLPRWHGILSLLCDHNDNMASPLQFCQYYGRVLSNFSPLVKFRNEVSLLHQKWVQNCVKMTPRHLTQ